MKVEIAFSKIDTILKSCINSMDIVLTAHVVAPRGHDNEIQLNCSQTEHLTIHEFNDIYQGLVEAGFFIKKVFFTEYEFIKDIINEPKAYSSAVVFNLCRNGTGMNKKTAIPAICDLLGVTNTSSGAGQCALARNKWIFTSYLSVNGVRCPISGLSAVDLADTLPVNTKVILKPINESASQGIDENSIVFLHEVTPKLDEETFIQEYIDGFECEVPVFCYDGGCHAMPLIGISFNSGADILSYSDSMIDNYDFYSLADKIPVDICKKIMIDAEKTFKLLSLETYGRVDFRIDKTTLQPYVIDIATTPYITKHSSFAFSIEQNGGQYSDIFRLIIAAALCRNK